MFESIFTSTAQDTISIGPAMLGLLTALVLGLLIGIAYMIACKKTVTTKTLSSVWYCFRRLCLLLSY